LATVAPAEDEPDTNDEDDGEHGQRAQGIVVRGRAESHVRE